LNWRREKAKQTARVPDKRNERSASKDHGRTSQRTEKLSRQSFEMANQQEKFKDYEDTVSRLKCELNATNEALVAQSAEPKIKELEQQLEKYKKDIAVHQKDKNELETLLEEAGDEYQSKDKELSVLKDQLVSVKVFTPPETVIDILLLIQ